MAVASRYNRSMGISQPATLPRGQRICARLRAPLALAVALIAVVSLAACDHLRLLDTKPLDRAGMSYDAIEEIKALHISQAEIDEIAKVRGAGLSDVDCVTILRMFHQRNEPFAAGDAIAGLYRSGMAEGTVLGLVNIDQVGLGAGDLQAIHLTGLPDELVMDIARDRAAGKSTLSGAALGTMKNLRMDNATLLELVRRGTPEPDGPRIIAKRRRGVKDTEILRHFPSTLN
jgi:hypothetical protein